MPTLRQLAVGISVLLLVSCATGPEEPALTRVDRTAAVNDPIPTSIEISGPTQLTLNSCGAAVYAARLFDQNHIEMTTISARTWTSDDIRLMFIPNPPRVQADGGVNITFCTAGNNGFGRISANYQAVFAHFSVDVGQPVASVRVSPSSVSASVGGPNVQLSATAVDQYGNTRTGRPTTWTSASPSIATVSTSGSVHAVAVGATTITARINNVPSNPVPVTVGTTVQVTPSVRTVTVAGNYSWTATAPGGTFTWRWVKIDLFSLIRTTLSNTGPTVSMTVTAGHSFMLEATAFQSGVQVGQATATLNNAISGSCRFC